MAAWPAVVSSLMTGFQLHRIGGFNMALVCYSPAHDSNTIPQPLSADRLLRMLGASGKLAGFRYAVYMIEQVRDHPEKIQLVTKNLYMKTAMLYGTTPNSVERNVRTLICTCWRYPDHTLLDQIAGFAMKTQPTNSQFIDILAAYLRS